MEVACPYALHFLMCARVLRLRSTNSGTQSQILDLYIKNVGVCGNSAGLGFFFCSLGNLGWTQDQLNSKLDFLFVWMWLGRCIEMWRYLQGIAKGFFENKIPHHPSFHPGLPCRMPFVIMAVQSYPTEFWLFNLSSYLFPAACSLLLLFSELPLISW